MTHPLTDDICDSLIKEFVGFDPDDMRTAADWQLKQVLEWLRATQDFNALVMADLLEEAMRPTQEENS